MAVMSVFGNVQIPQTRIGAKEALGYRGLRSISVQKSPPLNVPPFSESAPRSFIGCFVLFLDAIRV
jgi:hypothetical protein